MAARPTDRPAHLAGVPPRSPARAPLRGALPAVATLSAAAPVVPAWRRHLPQMLAVAAITLLLVAIAKPRRNVSVPVERATVVLVTDHSGSMQATDVKPTRLSAAEQAANAFIDRLPKSVRLGIVTFSGTNDMTQAPTTDHDLVRKTLEAQVAQGNTATGDALQAALQLLPRGAGAARSTAVVLLSDGKSNAGSDPIAVATQTGKKPKVPIYTVALGTAGATLPSQDPFGGPVDVSPDPEALRQIADVSGARAFQAGSGNELNAIYKDHSRLGHRTVKREITVGFIVAGLALLLGAAATSGCRPALGLTRPPARDDDGAVAAMRGRPHLSRLTRRERRPRGVRTIPRRLSPWNG